MGLRLGAPGQWAGLPGPARAGTFLTARALLRQAEQSVGLAHPTRSSPGHRLPLGATCVPDAPMCARQSQSGFWVTSLTVLSEDRARGHTQSFRASDSSPPAAWPLQSAVSDILVSLGWGGRGRSRSQPAGRPGAGTDHGDPPVCKQGNVSPGAGEGVGAPSRPDQTVRSVPSTRGTEMFPLRNMLLQRSHGTTSLLLRYLIDTHAHTLLIYTYTRTYVYTHLMYITHIRTSNMYTRVHIYTDNIHTHTYIYTPKI